MHRPNGNRFQNYPGYANRVRYKVKRGKGEGLLVKLYNTDVSTTFINSSAAEVIRHPDSKTALLRSKAASDTLLELRHCGSE